MENKPHISLVLPKELADTLRSRAKFNLRPLMKEVQFLIELGLAQESEHLRTLFKMIEPKA